MTEEDLHLFRAARENFLNVAAKLDAYNLRLDDIRIRMIRIEALFDTDRARIAAFEPLLAVVFGAPGQTTGLVERTLNLELRAVTWPQVAALASFCGVLSSIAATVTMLLARGQL